MIIYRPKRRTLDEAMKEARVFDNESDMIKFIVNEWNRGYKFNLFAIDDVVIDSEVVDDKRIGWHDTRLVCTKRMGDDYCMEILKTPQAIGFCATNFENENVIEGE